MTAVRVAMDAATDQAFAAAAESRRKQHSATLADAAEMAADIAEQFRGDEAAAGRAVMAVALQMGPLLARYEDFPGGLRLVPVVRALAAEQVVREAGAA